jgi:hypothetical protein
MRIEARNRNRVVAVERAYRPEAGSRLIAGFLFARAPARLVKALMPGANP